MSDRKEESVTRTPQSAEFETWLKEIARADGPPIHLPDLIGIGDRLADDRFEVTALLGRGGMGSVYRAWDHRDERAVALKTLRGRRPERLYRLKREFRALADVRHRNLVKLWELHGDGDRWFFTLELLAGDTISAYLTGRSSDDIRDGIGQLAAGLAALHDAGLVHRDVKPSNTVVEVGPGGARVVLLDFGLVADEGGSHQRGTVLGTATHMAPEQAAGEIPTAAADQYSLGVILFEVLTGELPTHAAALDQIADLEMRRLCRRLLGPPELRPSAADVARRLGVSLDAASSPHHHPLVGREREIEQLLGTLDEVEQTGTSVVVDVRGGPGHGKSALLEAFCAAAGRRGSMVLDGRCREREQVPFNALDSIIDGVVETLRDRGSTLATDLDPLARLFPALVAVCATTDESDRAEGSLGPSIDRQQAFARLAEMLARVAGNRPLCLAIDDAQWADADSAALLSSLLSSPALTVMAVLVTGVHRSPMSRRTELLGARVIDIELEPLADDDALALARSLLDDPTTERAASIATSSQGVPLFIHQLSRDGGRDGGVGSQLELVLQNRIAALDDTSAAALAAVSTASSVLTREMVLLAINADRQRGVEAVEGLERGRLIRAFRRRGETALEPYHPRIRDAALARLSAGEKRLFHRHIAAAIASLNPDDAIGLTHHWRHAGDIERARACVTTAAEAAFHHLAFDRAAELIATAFELGVPPTARLLLLRAEALEGAGRGALAADAYDAAAARTASEHGDPAMVRELERRAAEQLLRSGHIDAGIDAISAVLAAEGMPLPRSSLGSMLQLGIERLRLRFGRPSASGGGDIRRLEATWALAVGLSQIDPIRGALYQARHLRLALESGDPTRVALGLCADAMSAAAKGPPAEHAHQLLARAASVGGGSTDARVPAYLALAQAEVSFLCGEFSAARELARDADQLFSCCPGARWEQATAKLFYLTCLWHTGRLTALRDEASEATLEARALGDRYALTQLQTTVLPPMHLLADRPDLAEADLAEADEAWSRREMFLQHWQHLQASALLYLYRGEPRRALDAFNSRFVGTGKLILSQVKAVRVFTAYVRGISAVGALAQRPGDRDYERATERDIARLRREGETATTVALIEAQLHHVRGDRRATIDALREGIDAATSRDLLLMAASAQRCLGVLTGDDRALADADTYLSSHPIARPDRVAAMLMPAFARQLAS